MVYFTIDRWQPAADIDQFMGSAKLGYEALDDHLDHLTLPESMIGRGETA